MTKPPAPLVRFRDRSTALTGILLDAGIETPVLLPLLGQRSAPVQEANWLEVVAQAEKPYRKGAKR